MAIKEVHDLWTVFEQWVREKELRVATRAGEGLANDVVSRSLRSVREALLERHQLNRLQ
jgi:hypothetical protein